jgi:electron transfer flavoprotein beta subunit
MNKSEQVKGMREGNMEIVVCIKQVPSTSKVSVDEKTGVLNRNGVDSKINPYDLFALETALQIKQTTGAHIRVISMGPPQAASAIKEAFSMGVDQGVLLTDRCFAGADVLATAYAISQGIRKSGMPDLILCGKQTTDGDTAQVGPEIAEFLGIPHATNIRKLVELASEWVKVDMDLPEQVQTAVIPFPCLLTVEKDIYQPRLPSYRLKQSTSAREVILLKLGDLEDRDENHYGLNGSPTRVVRIFPPQVERSQETWQGDAESLSERLFSFLSSKKYI